MFTRQTFTATAAVANLTGVYFAEFAVDAIDVISNRHAAELGRGAQFAVQAGRGAQFAVQAG